MYKPLLAGLLLFVTLQSDAQTCQDVSVELSAIVEVTPPRITLNWKANAGANQNFVYRKSRAATSWGTAVATLTGSATQYVDTTVMPGVSYEYRITRSAANYNGFGYLNAAIELPAIEKRGVIIMVIDSTIAEPLTTEIERLHTDLEGDGWIVEPLIVDRNATVTSVKARIVSAYQSHAFVPRTLLLLGHVPVPYSGEINPDAHGDHLGAWPADVYYADVNGSWTDAVVNNEVASDPRNRNIPGDGKFDQSSIPTDTEMPVGRIDFSNMPAFGASEIELLRAYLDKDHAYRHKAFNPKRRILIDDNFGFFGTEAFAANGWRVTPLVGTGNVVVGDYFTDLADSSYLWSYGCGGGWFTGAGGIGSTTDFANANLQSVFTMLFGSYFGDWDSQNNFLRAALAQGQTLVNAWSGRPSWVFHHMGLGEPIGYSARISQNNQGLYFSGFSSRGVHVALMGDPTLRNDIVAPVSEVVAGINGTDAQITWKASGDPVLGYHIYVRQENAESFERVNAAMIQETAYTVPCLPDPGIYSYMVRAVVLQESPSGTYYNLSQGIVDTVWNPNDLNVTADATWSGSAGVTFFENLSVNATEFSWDFGDGNTSTEEEPSHTFDDGEFIVTLIASNGCDADTLTLDISISTSVDDDQTIGVLSITPNPSNGRLHVELDDSTGKIIIINPLGIVVFDQEITRDVFDLDLTEEPTGMYLMQISQHGQRFAQKILIQR